MSSAMITLSFISRLSVSFPDDALPAVFNLWTRVNLMMSHYLRSVQVDQELLELPSLP
jgi:hypothetical protein